jgi:hypothetical protein
MNFDQLKQFTTTEMQMSNINEPAMVNGNSEKKSQSKLLSDSW